ncbi:MAG TPA: response regulator transcription factor [Acidobacteriaceae bacterium]|jgi:two-component system, NarL family, nitrate/nitrite response regulator NarL|nr:response regulator transcription factor [Acidobacteriaceae bacterium]
MPEIRILLVDDHSLFRESLGRLLESDPSFRICGQCATLQEAVDLLSQRPADIVLLDYDLGEESGFALFAELRRLKSEAKVLMVTAGLSDEATLRIMEAGAAGIFLKHGHPDRLVIALRQIANGEMWMDNAAIQGLLAGSRNRGEDAQRTQSLTVRQTAVLRGILDGLANKEIAWKLKTSETSVKAVIQELFHKAGVRTRSQLVRIAIERHSSDWLHAGDKL